MAEVRLLEAVQGRWRSPARVAVVVFVLAYSWWVTTFRPFTWPIRISTAIPGVFLLLLAGRDRVLVVADCGDLGLGAAGAAARAQVALPDPELAERLGHQGARHPVPGVRALAPVRPGPVATMKALFLTVWIVLGLATVVAEVVGLLSGGRFPTLGDVMSFLMRSRVGRWFVLIGWVWLGWHLFVRSGVPGF